MRPCRSQTDQESHGHGGEHLGPLAAVLALTASFTLIEFVGGLLTGSLALLADAGHMLSDDLSLGLALFAVWIARRPSTPQRSFGFRRVEVLAALANGVTLVAIAIWIFVEAFQRFREPAEILGGWMLAIAVAGLVVNLLGVYLLHHGHEHSLNMAAAFWHVVADLLGSVGAITAAVVILATGWTLVDPLISVLIGLLVLTSSWGILRDSVNILLEATPQGLSAEKIHARMSAQPGIVEVYDLHVWMITSGFPALTAHVLIQPDENLRARRQDLERLLADEYGIEHTTLQVDHADAPTSREVEPPGEGSRIG